jgi:hypothetical protein
MSELEFDRNADNEENIFFLFQGICHKALIAFCLPLGEME